MEQIVSKLVNEENKILRECHGRRLAISRRVFKIQNTGHSWYVESESSNRFYFVEFKPNSNFCTCWDFASNRSDKCKHIYAVEYAVRLNLVKSIDKKLPISQIKKDSTKVADQYKNESIITLNEIEKAEIEAEAYRTKRQQSWKEDEYSW